MALYENYLVVVVVIVVVSSLQIVSCVLSSLCTDTDWSMIWNYRPQIRSPGHRDDVQNSAKYR